MNYEDLKQRLDVYLHDSETFWNEFYSNCERNIPFFENKPDENLVNYVKLGFLNAGKALELGCGTGRNAIFLAENGYKVDAVDLSEQSIKWANERATERNLEINFINQNIFELNVEHAKYDLIYDSGCFQHIAPHRRVD